jgi:RNA polymerase sigma factor (sigma-70 family)
MATAPHSLAHYLRHLGARAAGGLPDAHLLRHFAARRDEVAFTELVRRHGPMVLGVCRRLLGNEHDAEDAFQLTFVTLSRKAGSLRRPERLGPWLHGVAVRTARKARARAARRRACEQQAPPPAAVGPDDPVWRDLRPVLDEAVAALPARYREPVVLCYLGGQTLAEAARRLGCPKGTVGTRLAWARARLQARLARRGVTLSAAALAAALAGSAARACPAVAAQLVASTAQAATAAAGQGAAGAATIAPSRQGGKLMLLVQGKAAALLLALGVGAAVLCGRPVPPLAPPEAGAHSPGLKSKDTHADDLVLFLTGSTRFLLEDYRAADESFNGLLRRHAASPLAGRAAELAVLARDLRTAPPDAARKAAEGRRLIKAALDGPSPVEAAQAEKDFKVAEFYRRTGNAGAARFSYELVCRRYPTTALAVQSARRLRELREKTGKAPAGPGVEATVNGEAIRAADVAAAAYLAIAGAGDLTTAALARRIRGAWRATLEQVIEREVVRQHAVAALRARHPRALEALQDVAARQFDREWLRAAVSNGGTEKELRASLRALGTSLEAVRRQWQHDFVVKEYLRQRLPRAANAEGNPDEAARRERQRLSARLKREAVIEYTGRR